MLAAQELAGVARFRTDSTDDPREQDLPQLVTLGLLGTAVLLLAMKMTGPVAILAAQHRRSGLLRRLHGGRHLQ